MFDNFLFEKLRKRNIEQKRNAQFLACLLYTYDETSEYLESKENAKDSEIEDNQ